MTRIQKAGISGCRRTVNAISVILLGICGIVSGCKRNQTIWSAEVPSPDGKMVATARAFANGGFGVSGSPATFVYLNLTTGSQSPTEILALDDQSDNADEARVDIKWLAPNHLELSYLGKYQNVNFLAAKFDGVDISVRDKSNSEIR